MKENLPNDPEYIVVAHTYPYLYYNMRMMDPGYCMHLS